MVMQDPTQYLATFPCQRFIIPQDAIKRSLGRGWKKNGLLNSSSSPFSCWHLRLEERESETETLGGVLLLMVAGMVVLLMWLFLLLFVFLVVCFSCCLFLLLGLLFVFVV